MSRRNPSLAMGVDIGGSGVKAAIVDLARGELVSDRLRIATPRPATPDAILRTIATLHRRLDFRGPTGCGFPGSFRHGQVTVAPNLDPSWIGIDLGAELRRLLRTDAVAVGNDADAAGLAEVRFGAAKDVPGTVIVVTLGTGIGTAFFYNGTLLPGTELGHLELDGVDAELLASSRVRKEGNLSWQQWGEAVNRYLTHLQYLLDVDLFVIGGGVSKKAGKFLPWLESVRCDVVAARMGNLAGIIGAASLSRWR